MSLSYRENVLLKVNSLDTTRPDFAGSYTVTAYPVGAIASAGSSGATITCDAGHSFRVGDKFLRNPGSSNAYSADAVISVTNTSFTLTNSFAGVSAGDVFVNLGPDTGSTTPAYDGSPMLIFSDADGSTSVSNARVTATASGEYNYFHKGDGVFWELIRDGSGAVVDVIKGFSRVPSRFNVQDYGAKGDGTTDDQKSIQAAITALGSSGGSIFFPVGTYLVGSGSTLTLDSNSVIHGVGHGSILRKTAADTANLFTIDAGSSITIRDLACKKSAANSSASGAAVRIQGASTDIIVDGVLVDMFANGVRAEGSEGASASTGHRISCRSVHVKNTTAPTAGAYGFCFGDVQDVTVVDCHSSGMWLDGYKVRRKTSGVRILSCSGKSNGASTTGNGIDTFAGGDGVIISDSEFSSNQGSGINIKTGDLNDSTAGHFDTYGAVRNTIVSGCRSYSNTTIGLEINRSSAAVATEPLAAHIDVLGGYYGENGDQGIYVRGRNVSIVGAIVRKNGTDGIVVQAESLDVTISRCIVVANGQDAAATYYGINLLGVRAYVDGCIIHGKDTDTLAQDSDYSAATAYHVRPIRVGSAADKIYIGPNNSYQGSSASDTVLVSATTGEVVIDQVYNAVVNYGAGPGSISRRFNASGVPMLWLKTKNYDGTGWYPLHHPDTASSAFSANDATPSVANLWFVRTANTAGTTITAFDDGIRGQEIVVIINDANTTIDFTGTTLKGNGGADWTPTTGDHMTCIFDGTNWYCRISDNTA